MRFIVSILLIIIGPITGFAQDSKISKGEQERMEMTIAYYLIQLNSIEAIAAIYPKLAIPAQDALREWNNEFYNSIQEIDRLLLLNDSAGWTSKKDLMVMKYSRADYSRIKENDARDYVFEVNSRAVGKIESPVLETLLEFNPQYRQEPEREFAERYVKEIFTKKIPNAQGLDMKIYVPQSWKQVSDNIKGGPAVTYASRFGEGNFYLSVYIDKVKSAAEGRKMLVQPVLIKNYCSDNDAVEFKTRLYIDNCPAARVTFDQPNGNVEKIGEIYGFAYKDYYIRLLLELKIPIAEKDTVAKEYERNKVLMQKIKDSVVILSQWNQKSK